MGTVTDHLCLHCEAPVYLDPHGWTDFDGQQQTTDDDPHRHYVSFDTDENRRLLDVALRLLGDFHTSTVDGAAFQASRYDDGISDLQRRAEADFDPRDW